MSAAPYHHGNLRAALLEHAAAELDETGIEKLSLRQVAKRACVSHAAFAHHFGSAQGLLTALAAEGFTLFDEALSAARSQGATNGTNSLQTSGLAYVEFALKHPQLFALMFSSQLPDFLDPALDEASMRVFRNFVAEVRECREHKDVDANGVDVPAMAYWAKVHGLATLMLTGRMRSVLSLGSSERKTALKQILAFGQK